MKFKFRNELKICLSEYNTKTNHRRGTPSIRMMYFLMVIVILNVVMPVCWGFRCDRIPKGRVPPQSTPDGRFEVKISGNPTLYVPGQVYTVSIEGKTTGLAPNQFIGFMLVAQPKDTTPQTYGISLGSFEPTDSLAKYHDRCQNSIMHSSQVPKTKVQVYWTAPPSGSGCVTIKATVVENKDLWYKDGIWLKKDLCEDLEESPDVQPPVVDRCCACDEAKYEMIFEGLWSRQTHPKNFPNNSWEAKFSDVIGASHSAEYQFWQYGKSAGEGLHEVAANGTTKMLESEFKNVSNHIRTIIKARGISYPNVTAKTFAVFRVNNKHHLISLVSKIIPSPDWIVGVSSLELCLANCSWAEKKELSLYPWDAGTEDGISYKSNPIPTYPRDIIRRISTSFPANPDSPFFDDQGGKMQPLGRLYLTRQRLYEKTCDTDVGEPDGDEDSLNTGPCKVGPWKDISSCSVSCGRGTKQQRRFYVNEISSRIRNCKRVLFKEVKCIRPCNTGITEVSNDPYCQLTEWSEWSSCSATCGEGTRTRDRTYVHRNGQKLCTKGKYFLPVLQDNEQCTGEKGECDENENVEVYEKEGCEMSLWTNWTPCSKSCGKGIKTRRRTKFERFDSYPHRRSPHRRHTRHRRQDDGDDENGSDYDEADACDGVKTYEQVECIATSPSCDVDAEQSRADPIDSGKFVVGNQILDSSLFGGNNNRYATVRYPQEQDTNHIDQAYQETDDSVNSNEVIDCKTSLWSEWSECNANCGNGYQHTAKGYQHRYRKIVEYPANGGKPCPKKLTRKRKCEIQCNNEVYRDPLTPTWGPP
ncbi:spondin-1-like isoform X3 [Chrysoperla carnea]|uniref:spondin-1-like isoform X3 n=1 Tax=Chrysoperla carnea TaxID=189513 RepID=UPI001D0667F5|nr:spondin-1-like isoform X3 [Chrysoperla carnea]